MRVLPAASEQLHERPRRHGGDAAGDLDHGSRAPAAAGVAVARCRGALGGTHHRRGGHLVAALLLLRRQHVRQVIVDELLLLVVVVVVVVALAACLVDFVSSVVLACFISCWLASQSTVPLFVLLCTTDRPTDRPTD